MEIKLENVSYPEKNQKSNIQNLNFDFEEGQVTTIIGTNQNDLDNLLDIISLNKKAPKGTIIIDNQKVNGKTIKNLKQNISYCPKNYKFTETTVKEELIKVLRNSKIQDQNKRIDDTIKMIGLSNNILDRKISSLSSGEKQKILLALNLVTNPKILILNNPTKNLDSQSIIHITKLLILMKLRYKKNIIITSENTDFLLELSNTIYILDDDNLKKQTDKYKVFSNSALLKRCNLNIPKTIEFSKLVKQKQNLNIGNRDNINDLIKDIYRFTESNK